MEMNQSGMGMGGGGGGIGGAGFPTPPLPPGQHPLGVTGPKIDMKRGIDLAVLRDKSKHQHRWIMTANFRVDDAVIAKMAEARLAFAQSVDTGKEYLGGPINIPMGQETLIGTDGPGCAKCGIFWESEDGWGKMCPVSDEKFAEAGAPLTTPVTGNAGAGMVAVDEDGTVGRPLDPENQPANLLAKSGEEK